MVPRPVRLCHPQRVVDADEATAVLVGLRTLVDTGAADGETALRALARLEDRLPPRVRLAAGTTPGSSILMLLARACAGGDRVRFTYRTRAGVESTRRVAAEALVLLQGRWFLVGWDQMVRGWRVFRAAGVADPGIVTARSAAARLRRALPDGLTPQAFVAAWILGGGASEAGALEAGAVGTGAVEDDGSGGDGLKGVAGADG